jgi:hypothetical protein
MVQHCGTALAKWEEMGEEKEEEMVCSNCNFFLPLSYCSFKRLYYTLPIATHHKVHKGSGDRYIATAKHS